MKQDPNFIYKKLPQVINIRETPGFSEPNVNIGESQPVLAISIQTLISLLSLSSLSYTLIHEIMMGPLPKLEEGADKATQLVVFWWIKRRQPEQRDEEHLLSCYSDLAVLLQCHLWQRGIPPVFLGIRICFTTTTRLKSLFILPSLLYLLQGFTTSAIQEDKNAQLDPAGEFVFSNSIFFTNIDFFMCNL